MTNYRCQCGWLPADESCSEPVYVEVSGRKYCVLHYPEPSKAKDFWEALQPRLDEKNEHYLKFVGVWFPSGVSFSGYTFASAVDFSGAKFNTYVDFRRSEFQDVNFSDAEFGGYANFEGATFSGTANFFKADFQQDASFGRCADSGA